MGEINITIFKCDNCGKEKQPTYWPRWFNVTVSFVYYDSQEPNHFMDRSSEKLKKRGCFCCMNCYHKWFMQFCCGNDQEAAFIRRIELDHITNTSHLT